MNIKSDFDYLVKLALLGDPSVGKTNIVIRFVDHTFSLNTTSTIGYDYKSKKISIGKEKLFLQIWDTAGQERYMALNKTILQKADGIMLVYDISQRETFNNIQKWIDTIKEHNDKLPIILIGNKTDKKDERIVDILEGKKLAEDHNITFLETSALNGENIDKAFINFSNIVLDFLKNKVKKVDDCFSLNSKISQNKKKKKKCC